MGYSDNLHHVRKSDFFAHRRRDHRPDDDLPGLGGEDGPAAGRLPDGPRLLRIPLLYVHLLHSRSGESEIKGKMYEKQVDVMINRRTSSERS